MTSQVNPNNIDGTYPVAGQDNDSQGFRDNFTNIRNNLTYVKAEIEDIQNKAIFKTALTNTTLDNDFYGNIVSNPSFTAYRETYNNIGSVSGAVTINFANGNFQRITMSGSTTLAFSFPSNTSNQYAAIKLWVTNPNASYTLTLPSAVTLGDPDTVAGLSGTSPPIITFNAAEIANNTNYLFEFFTVDGGTTIGIKDLIRNRDLDLSGLSITGNLSLDNISASGNIVTTNGVFWAGNGNPFIPSLTTLSTSGIATINGNLVAAATTASTDSTTGALVVKGGAGIAGVVNIDGNTRIGGNLILSGTAGNLPLLFSTSGANVDVPARGAVEYNATANVFYATPTVGTSSGRALIPTTHYALLGSNVAINNGTAPALTTSYSIFGGPVAAGTTIGNVMLAAGTTYEFDVHSMVSMAAAPTASSVGFTFGGNATTSFFTYEVQSYPVSGTGGLNQGNTTHWYGTTTFPATSAVVLNTQAYLNFSIRARGLVRINAQGTLLPLIQWNTAPAQIATAVQGTYMKFTPIGTAANVVVGTVMGTPFV